MSDEPESGDDHDLARHHEKMAKKKAARAKIMAGKTIERGLLIVHTGKGKGKSTAAFGMVFRCIGHGMRSGVIQFIKGAWDTGERTVLENYPDLVTIKAAGEGFTWETQDRARDVAHARDGWEQAKKMIADPSYKMVLLDELNIVLRAMRQLDRERGAADERPGAMLEAVAQLLDRPVAEIRQLLALNERSASLDSPLDIDPDLSMADSMADEAAEDPAAHLAQHEAEALVADWVAQLTDRQRLVVECRYGLGGQDVTTLEVIAKDLGLTRERVRQIQMEALSQLRKRIAHDGLTPGALL